VIITIYEHFAVASVSVSRPLGQDPQESEDECGPGWKVVMAAKDEGLARMLRAT
jgi:hypothetical protein